MSEGRVGGRTGLVENVVRQSGQKDRMSGEHRMGRVG